MEAAPAALALLLALLHLFSGRLRFIRYLPRSRWLSFAGGVSVAYVFLHLLPELAAGQEAIAERGPLLGVAERHVYLVALFGLAAFYGLERLAARSRAEHRERTGDDCAPPGVFRVHVASFAFYNALVGYLLLRGESESLRSLLLFAAAMGLHFVINDFGLREHHRREYDRVGRWVLSAGVLAGCAVGYAAPLPEAAVSAATAFLAGGIILNVLKEEVPDERGSRFGSLLLGMALYTALLLAV